MNRIEHLKEFFKYSQVYTDLLTNEELKSGLKWNRIRIHIIRMVMHRQFSELIGIKDLCSLEVRVTGRSVTHSTYLSSVEYANNLLKSQKNKQTLIHQFTNRVEDQLKKYD